MKIRMSTMGESVFDGVGRAYFSRVPLYLFIGLDMIGLKFIFNTSHQMGGNNEKT